MCYNVYVIERGRKADIRKGQLTLAFSYAYCPLGLSPLSHPKNNSVLSPTVKTIARWHKNKFYFNLKKMTSSQVKSIILKSLREVLDETDIEIIFYESRPDSTERTLADAALKISKKLNVKFSLVMSLLMREMDYYCNEYKEKSCTTYVCNKNCLHLIVSNIFKKLKNEQL